MTSKKSKPSDPLKFFFFFLRGIALWTSTIVLTIFFGSLAIILSPIVYVFDKNRGLLHNIGVIWAKSLWLANPWWTLEIIGQKNLAKKGVPVVYVSNHQSQADILAIFAIHMPFKWLAKASLFFIPFIGWAMWTTGYVAVWRKDPKSRQKCLEKSAEYLRRGVPMLFFPEGTRSKNGSLGSFKQGAFRLAKDLEVPVVPITILGCDTLLPKGSLWPNTASVKVIIHPPLSSTNLTVEELLQKTRACIATPLPKEKQGFSL
jgi:1-acyl-sn-glycerol-3-phosphate acyltransferase